MKIIFLGVGSASDENYPNNSQLVVSEKTKLILDCGFTAPPQLWKFNSGHDFLDAIYISHQHADHYFGLPIVLERMWEEGREKELTIICQKELEDSFWQLMDFAYRGFFEKFKYKINFIEAKIGKSAEFHDLKLSFGKTTHPREDLAIKIENDGKSVIYSGDGAPERGDFYKNSDLLIQETYLYDQDKMGHASIVSAIKFAEDNNIKCLALTHMNRNFRKNELPEIRDKIKSDKVKIIIPEPLEECNI